MVPVGGGSEGFGDAVAALWEEARPRALERVAVVEDAVAALMAGALGDEERDRARAEAHKLAGALGTFGVPEGSTIARTLEEKLAAGPVHADAPALAEAVLELRGAVERGRSADPAAGEGPRVVLAGLPSARSAPLLRAGSGRPWRLSTAAAPPAPGEADVVLLAPDVPDLPGTVARLTDGGAAVAVLTGGDADRVELVRVGARRLLPATLEADAVVAELAELDAGRRARSATVLAVDDDPIMLALLEASLRRGGFELATCVDPLAFWAALETARPDLVVLDVQMPGADGPELCRAMRADPRWRSVPVLFLTATTEPAVIADLFAAGGDDYLPKPVDPAELTARVTGRLERTRTLRSEGDEDERTGLLRREVAEPYLAGLVDIAVRLKQPIAVAAIGVDELAEEHRDWALGCAGEAVRAGLGAGELGARWSADTLLVAMLGLDGHDARERLGELVEGFRRAPRPDGRPEATLSAGVAEHPRDGADAPALADAATGALGDARREGGDRVAAAGGTHAEGGAYDVVVVEDDDVLAELVLHALGTRGYRTRWIADGDEAARLLGGARPPVQADLVLLDWDLPARDGLTVLRGLAADGVLETTRVVMLTMHASEREVLATLELGATDHIAKPFSVAVLMQRVRRMLAR
jgi:DNA-binding response OmpR family regulator/HPt (histidine-containing phosphotransfer) domain-containing protein